MCTAAGSVAVAARQVVMYALIMIQRCWMAVDANKSLADGPKLSNFLADFSVHGSTFVCTYHFI